MKHPYTVAFLLACLLSVQHIKAQGLRAGGNDECEGALLLTPGNECLPVEGNSIGATQSLDPATDCGPYVAGEALDVWYVFTAAAQATSIEVVGMGDYDVVVQVLSGECGSLLPLACADVTYPPDNGSSEMILFSTTIGQSYHVRVYRFAGQGSEEVDFTICVMNVTTYCTAAADECDEYVAQLSVGVFSNTSDCTEGGYVDYTQQVIELEAGVVVPITVLNGPAVYAEDSVGVWVDWNNDFLFSAAEGMVLSSEDQGFTFTGAIFPPDDPVPGNIRLRVRMVYNTTPLACGGSAYGETEDYSVHVSIPAAIDASATTQSSWSVFPNPSNGNITVTYMDAPATVNIELLDLAGRVVFGEQRLLNKGQNVALQLAGTVAAGNYALRLTSAQGRSAQRLVVK